MSPGFLRRKAEIIPQTVDKAPRWVRVAVLMAVFAGAVGLHSAASRPEDLFSLTAKLTKALPEIGSTFYGPWLEKFAPAGRRPAFSGRPWS